MLHVPSKACGSPAAGTLQEFLHEALRRLDAALHLAMLDRLRSPYIYIIIYIKKYIYQE